jgi:hypothetical protein
LNPFQSFNWLIAVDLSIQRQRAGVTRYTVFGWTVSLMEFQFDDEECEDTGHGGLSGTEEPVPPLVDPISPCLSDSSHEDEAMEASSLPITPQPVSSIVKSI